MTLKLYANKGNFRANKALIAAKYAGVEVETTPDFKVGVDNLAPEFLEKNPLGKVPVLETDEGVIFESNAIARYIARLDDNNYGYLFGADEYEAALIEQFLDFAIAEIELPSKVWLYPIYGYMENNQQATNKAKGDIRKILEILNDHLNTRTFLVGERVSLADIVVALHMQGLFQKVLDNGFRKPFENVVRWFTTVVNQPHFKEVLGEVSLCNKMEVAKASASTQDNAQKQEKPKQAPKAEKPKVEKPKEEKKPKKKEEDEEEEDYSEKRGANPLEALPPSKFDLEAWKRNYSNNEGSESIKYFWENFDPQGFSIWFADYKYNDELDSLLRTCNLIGGWFQRLDRLRKYGFGSALIFKNEAGNHYEISSVWVVRGQELPAEVTQCDDTELYNWTKVEDTTDQAARTKVQEYFNWEGQFGGKKFEQGKVYK